MGSSINRATLLKLIVHCAKRIDEDQFHVLWDLIGQALQAGLIDVETEVDLDALKREMKELRSAS